MLVWNELFHVSPSFSELYLPETVRVAIDRFIRRLEDPWGKQSTSALGDKEEHKQLTLEPASSSPAEDKTKYPTAPWHQGAHSASPSSEQQSWWESTQGWKGGVTCQQAETTQASSEWQGSSSSAAEPSTPVSTWQWLAPKDEQEPAPRRPRRS